MSVLYYTAPSQEIFEDMKSNAIKLWQTCDDEFGYATGKINVVKDIGNIKDNFMYILAMFDPSNQFKLLLTLKGETIEEISKRSI